MTDRFWPTGTQIQWHYREPRWAPGNPEHVAPMTAVQDNTDALVAWLAPGPRWPIPPLP